MKQLLTDYPLFKEEYGRAGPFRLVTVKDYDGNKYCTIEYNGVEYSIKAGYLYRSRRRKALYHKTYCRWFNRKV